MSDAAPQLSSGEPVVIRYRFRFSDGREQTFAAELDAATLQLRQPARASYPDWTRLEHSQCPGCPLRASETPHCPAATSLVDVVDYFNRALSFEEVEVEVQTKERRVVKRCSMQEAVGSLIGIYMPTSGCPVLAKLRPMARFHLPFAGSLETFYRVLSMSLLAQFFQAKHGRQPDWTWNDLIELCREIQDVDSHLFQRLVPVVAQDASLNAIVRLHAQTNVLEFILDEGQLGELEQLFQAYWDGKPAGGPPAAPS